MIAGIIFIALLIGAFTALLDYSLIFGILAIIAFVGYVVFIIPGFGPAVEHVDKHGVPEHWNHNRGARRRREKANNRMLSRSMHANAIAYWHRKLRIDETNN